MGRHHDTRGLERNGLFVFFLPESDSRRCEGEGSCHLFKKTMAVGSTCSDLKRTCRFFRGQLHPCCVMCWSASMLGGHCQGSQKPYFFGQGS